MPKVPGQHGVWETHLVLPGGHLFFLQILYFLDDELKKNKIARIALWFDYKVCGECFGLSLAVLS